MRSIRSTALIAASMAMSQSVVAAANPSGIDEATNVNLSPKRKVRKNTLAVTNPNTANDAIKRRKAGRMHLVYGTIAIQNRWTEDYHEHNRERARNARRQSA